MPADQRAQLRAVFKRVHPDLFAADPDARAVNAESLQVLNAYCDDLATGRLPAEARLLFFVRDGPAAVPSAGPASSQTAVTDGGTDALRRVEAVLPARGSLAPLLHAFGLLSGAELQQEEQAARQATGRGKQDRGLLTWLHEAVAEAVRASEEADATAAAVAAHRGVIQHAYQLADLQAGTALTASAEQQQGWLHALDMLDAALSLLTDAQPDRFAGLLVRLAQPLEGDDVPLGWSVAADSRDKALSQQTHVTGSGALHIVADERHLLEAVDALDLQRARLLTRLSDFWDRQARALMPPVRELLGVAAVWHDSNADLASQRFVLWASRLLEAEEAVAAYSAVLAAVATGSSAAANSPDSAGSVDFAASSGMSGNGSGGGSWGIDDGIQASFGGAGLADEHTSAPNSMYRAQLPVSVLVHCEMDGPPVEMLASRNLLQVRHDCPPKTLLATLTLAVEGDTFAAAGPNAEAQAAEASLLEAACAALGARRLVRVCTHCTPADVLEAARRLIDHATEIRSAVSLAGASIAIDDRFEVWDSGYISVPFDFKVEELQNSLRQKLLGGDDGGRRSPPMPVTAALGNSFAHGPRFGNIAAAAAFGTSGRSMRLGPALGGSSFEHGRQMQRKQPSLRLACVPAQWRLRHRPVLRGCSSAFASIV